MSNKKFKSKLVITSVEKHSVWPGKYFFGKIFSILCSLCMAASIFEMVVASPVILCNKIAHGSQRTPEHRTVFNLQLQHLGGMIVKAKIN